MSSIAHLNQNIKTLCTAGYLKEAMHILLTAHNLPVQSSTYIHLLQACVEKKALSEGRKVHFHINDRGFSFAIHSFLQNKLINMYDKCGSLVDARSVFDNMTEPNVFSWNMIISAYKRHGLPHQAFTLFYQMQRTAVKPDHFTFSSVLPVCTTVATLSHGFQIHGKVIRCGFEFHDIVMNSLIDMYAKSGRIEKARELFDRMPNSSVVSWNAIITGYAQNGLLDEVLRLFEEIPQKDVVSWTAVIAGCAQNGFVEKALEFFKQMQLAGIEADSSTLASILPACAKMGALEQGMEIHHKIIERRFLPHVVVTTALIDMYTKCESIDKAHQLFDEMPQRNVVSWTAIITGYAQNGPIHKAFELFNQMQLACEKTNSSTFVGILLACAKMGALEQGMNVHAKIIESGLLSNDVVATSLVNMYAKCASISKAREIFDKMHKANVFTWTAMITGYAQNSFLDEALSLFKEMPDRNAVSWNAIIAGYAQNGQVEKAMEIFKQMQSTDVNPDKLTFASILPACSKIGALKQGMEFHQKIIEMGFLSDMVATSVIDMYAKCGSIKKARELFDRMKHPDVASWNAMISGYAMHGHSQDALKLFELMKHCQSKPNYISFVCILFACSHAGLLDDSCKYFNQMTHFYSIIPTIDHYVCMVDLLGRAGCFEGALHFIIKMAIKPDSVVWISLLGACRSHKNLHLGEFVATLLFELDHTNTAPYVLLSNIYAEIGRWDNARNVRKLMKDRGIRKIPGCSWIEVHKTVHVFCVGDKSHPQTQEIYAMLEKLSSELKAAGYAPDTKPVLNDVEDEEKELLLCYHSEKLAIAFGLLHMSAGTTIRVVKNLRVCSDCHTATKFISKIVAREIIVRDSNRFHHFKHGHCSCGDYW